MLCVKQKTNYYFYISMVVDGIPELKIANILLNILLCVHQNIKNIFFSFKFSPYKQNAIAKTT